MAKKENRDAVPFMWQFTEGAEDLLPCRVQLQRRGVWALVQVCQPCQDLWRGERWQTEHITINLHSTRLHTGERQRYMLLKRIALGTYNPLWASKRQQWQWKCSKLFRKDGGKILGRNQDLARKAHLPQNKVWFNLFLFLFHTVWSRDFWTHLLSPSDVSMSCGVPACCCWVEGNLIEPEECEGESWCTARHPEQTEWCFSAALKLSLQLSKGKTKDKWESRHARMTRLKKTDWTTIW